MKQRAFWNLFIKMYPEFDHEVYTAWSFGENPTILGQRVIEGKKQATTSARVLYTVEQDPLPFVGQLNMILNENREPMCITITTHVNVVPFNQVGYGHVINEGEGYTSIEQWRSEHYHYLKEACQYYGLDFHEEEDVVLETFKCIYPVNSKH